MIPRIHWPEVSFANESPFIVGGQERPLKLTIHDDKGITYSKKEIEAIGLMYELSSEKEVDVLNFDGDRAPQIVFSESSSNSAYSPIKVVGPSGEEIFRHQGVLKSTISDQAVQLIFNIHDKNKDNYKTAMKHLMAYEAHHALDRDIFVTGSSFIIGARNHLKMGNPRIPLEACRIMGLCMRSRDNWTYQKTPKKTYVTGLGMVYWVVMRARLPSMWKYFSILLRASKKHGDELGRIGQTILERCSRALQARDEIGKRFYLDQNNTTREMMMYHFDYLTLLIAGVYDSLAIIVNRAYHLLGNERDVGFRRSNFRKALKSSEAKDLAKLLSSRRVELLEVMLHNLRNTIHSAGLGTYAYADKDMNQESYARLPPGFRDEILEAAKELSSAEDWGIYKDEFKKRDEETGELVPSYEIAFEPYSYADALLEHWFSLIDDIAKLTEVERLFSGDLGGLDTKMPGDWNEYVRRFELFVG